MGPEDNASLLTDPNLDAGRGKEVALITDTGEALTFGDVHRLASRFAARLVDSGDAGFSLDIVSPQGLVLRVDVRFRADGQLQVNAY